MHRGNVRGQHRIRHGDKEAAAKRVQSMLSFFFDGIERQCESYYFMGVGNSSV